MFSSKDLFFTPAASGAYTVSKSLRFRSSASAYLSRTPASAGNRTVWTWSCWVKRAKLGARQELLCADVNGTNDASDIYFDTSDRLNVQNFVGGVLKTQKITNAIFRDPSAWYHIVVSQNGSTACNVYVNGVSQTFSTSTGPDATNWYINSTTPHSIGNDSQLSANYLDGYLADVNFIGGSALDATSFGAYDTNGIWQPIAYTGSYSGTNSFYLKFTTVGATSGSNTGYGQDFSGNGNYWTTNNLSSTAGTTYDSMLDSPTNATGDIGNYCALNPLDSGGPTTNIVNANLQLNSGTDGSVRSTFWISPSDTQGYYFEMQSTTLSTSGSTGGGVGSAQKFLTNSVGWTTSGWDAAGFIKRGSGGGDKWNWYSANVGGGGLSDQDTGIVAATTDILQVAIKNGKVWLGINNTWQNSGSPTGGTGQIITATNPISPFLIASTTGTMVVNSGQRPFTYTPPSGFSALTTQNLPTPTIANGAQYMAAVLYNGTSASNTVTTSSSNSGNNPNGTTFQPDLVWIKSRSAATDHKLTDAVRGTTKAIVSNSSNAQTTDANGLTAFTSSGFTVGSDSTYNNGTGPATYVAWEWNGGGSTVTNTTGSIQSSVRASTTAGFSIVSYSQGATNGTVGHGLGAVPGMIICRSTDNGGTSWIVYHSSLGKDTIIRLNTTDAASTVSNLWGTSNPTSTVFGVGTAGSNSNNLGSVIAYCFAPVTGFSAMGSYVGNGSTDGPFIYTGFRSRWIMIKCTSTSSVPSYDSWKIIDTSRSPYNAANPAPLWANANYQEGLRGNGSANTATLYENILSNGFKLGTGSSYEVETNESGETYIWAAFAENPFNIARAR